METAAGEQPQPTTQPVAGAQPQPVANDISNAIDAMTDEAQLKDLLFGNPQPPTAQPEPQAQEPAGTQPPADPNPEPTPAGEQPQEPTEEPNPQDPPPQPQSLDRISLKSLHPDDRLLIANAKEMVREGKAASFADAIMSLTGTGTQEPPPAAEAQADPTLEPAPIAPNLDVDRITQHIAQLRQQRAAAVADYDRTGELELTSQIEDALAELSEAKAAQALQTREQSLQQQTLQAVIEDVYVTYPESENPESFFSFRLTQEVNKYEAQHGDIGRHPAQLRALAQRVAAEINPAQASPQPTQTPAPAPRQVARPVGVAAPGSAASARFTPDQINIALNTATEEELGAALFGAR
jgi:hypothetical protein